MPAAAYPVSRSANAASVEQFLVRFFIAHLHASDWRNESGAIPPVARDFRVYFALVQSPEEGHCTKRRKSGASASNDHRTFIQIRMKVAGGPVRIAHVSCVTSLQCRRVDRQSLTKALARLLGLHWAPIVGCSNGLLRGCECRELYARFGSRPADLPWLLRPVAQVASDADRPPPVIRHRFVDRRQSSFLR